MISGPWIIEGRSEYYYALYDSGRADKRAPSVLLGTRDGIIIEFRDPVSMGWVIIKFRGLGVYN